MVRQWVAPVNDRVAHSFVRVCKAYLCTEARFNALLGPLFHPLEALKILLHSKVTITRRNAIHTLCLHLLCISIVRIRR